MKMTLILFSTLLLLSCGGGSNDTGPVKLDSNKIYVKVLKSVGNYSIDGPPLEGTVVQLDHDGENQTTDKNGVVSFTINDSLEHDIHIFGQNGYNWHSIYSVKKGILNKFQLSHRDGIAKVKETIASYLSFKITIPTIPTDSEYKFIFYDTKSKRRYYGDFYLPTRTNNIFDVDFMIDAPVGTTITGELIVLEYQKTVTERILIDSAIMLENSYSTSKFQNVIISQTIDTLKINKLAQTDIISINKFEIPKGFTLSKLFLFRDSAVDIKNRMLDRRVYETNQVLAKPRKLTSYTSYDYESVLYNAVSFKKLSLINNAKQIIWQISGNTPRYSTVDIVPKLTVYPDFQENQSGDILNWNSVDGNLLEQYLTISEIQTKSLQSISRWNFELNPKSTMLRLPTIPTGISPLLALNNMYAVRIIGAANFPSDYESYELTDAKWTYQ